MKLWFSLVLFTACAPAAEGRPITTASVAATADTSAPPTEPISKKKPKKSWPSGPDRDGDGIPDAHDKCPDEPEDFDGFEDDDGCPEPDNDQDGVLDKDDNCPNIPGPVSNKGCPTKKVGDRDHDGIPDDLDKCPDDPEDKDGFQDDDGCPDPDNDHDGILDKDDQCPNDPEDKDGFQDDDGCPDPDNDQDGILDVDDKCPNQPGPKSNGGCPKK